ncbi:hypothetical protein ACGFYP_34440 [Streptomyces sp. NPDC048370]|uniref:hypothetical protein n=1 Tax=Streptomyces sp. NPDC048370 TaxID=3365540 RepID=UPI003723D33D
MDLPQVSVSDLAYAWQPATLTFNSSVGATAQRSPAHSGAQVIVATYFLERWNGQAWVTITQKQYVVQLAANQAEVKIPAIYFQPTSGTGYYRMTFGFVWMLAGASTFLGTQRWVPNGANDHACVTTLRPCEAGADSVRVGKLYRLGGGW